MWLYREFDFNGHVVNFLNKNHHIINSVSVTTNLSKIDLITRYVVFFRLNEGVSEDALKN